METTTDSQPASPHRPAMLATRIQPRFADQTWSTRTIDAVPCFRAFLLLRGQAVFTAHEATPIELTAPRMLWAPFSTGGNFRLCAGGDGASILAAEDLVWRTVGDNPLSALLRRTLERALVAPAERIESALLELDALFAGLARETRDPGPGALRRRKRSARRGRAHGAALPPARRNALPRQARRRRLLQDVERDARPPAQRLRPGPRPIA